VRANQDTFPVGVMCRLLKVSTSGFYDWRGRPLSQHDRQDVELAALIHTSYERSHRTYGARRVHAELREGYGVRVGRKRVARLMRRAGLKGVQKRRFRCTTRSGAPERWAPDLVERNFLADRPDALWVADVTYVPTAEGFLYLALVLDVFSRLIVGWAMADRLRSELVQQALQMAYAQRVPRAVIHHSDHGSEGDFQRSSQHLAIGGVAWDDQRVGLQSGLDVRRCGRRVDRASTSGMPSRRSGRALRRELQVRMLHWRATCRSRLARAGSGRPVGWHRSVWLRSRDDICRSLIVRSWRC